MLAHPATPNNSSTQADTILPAATAPEDHTHTCTHETTRLLVDYSPVYEPLLCQHVMHQPTLSSPVRRDHPLPSDTPCSNMPCTLHHQPHVTGQAFYLGLCSARPHAIASLHAPVAALFAQVFGSCLLLQLLHGPHSQLRLQRPLLLA